MYICCVSFLFRRLLSFGVKILVIFYVDLWVEFFVLMCFRLLRWVWSLSCFVVRVFCILLGFLGIGEWMMEEMVVEVNVWGVVVVMVIEED